jgi:hypothetical protein
MDVVFLMPALSLMDSCALVSRSFTVISARVFSYFWYWKAAVGEMRGEIIGAG